MLYEHLFADLNPIWEVVSSNGEIKINSSISDRTPSFAIQGRLIYDGDILRLKQNSQMQLESLKENIIISVLGSSELKLDCNNKECFIKLNYGKILLDSPANNKLNFYVKTMYSKVLLNNNQIWMTRSIRGRDEIFSINGTVNFTSFGSTLQKIKSGNRFSINNKGFNTTDKITKNMLPDFIYQKLHNKNILKEDPPPITVMNYFTNDLLLKTTHTEKIRTNPLKLTIESGASIIENSQYGKVSFTPIFIGDKYKIGYHINGFIGLSDTSKNLNNFSTLSQILAPIIFNYKSTNNNFQLNIGHLNNLSFGYGSLLKRYTNTVSYPIKQDAGLVFDYHSNAKDIELNFFISSIDQFSNGNSLIGINYNIIIKNLKKLKIGFGAVSDMNQFGATADSIWHKVSKRERSVTGYQFNFTYELKSDLLNDTYLFGEFTLLNYPNALRYIRKNLENGEIIEEGFSRNNSFGILWPGIYWKLGHYRNIKIAFSYSSSLHMTPFFGETYNLERVRFIQSSILDSIDANEPYNQDEKWNTMIKENHVNLDSTAYFLPKDIYALLNPTLNVYNKIGLYLEYNYKFRNYYNYYFDFSFFNNLKSNDVSYPYYTLGMGLSINEGLINRISEFEIFLNQYFTSEPFNILNYKENTIYGAKLGIMLTKKIFFKIYRHDVFYDNNINGNLDLNSTTGTSLIIKF